MTSKEYTLQQLPPQAAHFCLGVENFLRQELGLNLQGQKLIVAFSGGADSSALLLALHALRKREAFKNTQMLLAHLNHALRPDADKEELEAAALAAELGLEFYSRKEDIAQRAAIQRIGLEEAGRDARREFLTELRLKSGATWIFMGHQLNDLAEDILMRLLRGAGWPALAGMRALDTQGHILRPLLLTPRIAIESFLTSLGRSWVEDASNMAQDFLRNRVRSSILPLFLRENPAFLDSAANMWRMANLDRAWLEAECSAVLTQVEAALPQAASASLRAQTNQLPSALPNAFPGALPDLQPVQQTHPTPPGDVFLPEQLLRDKPQALRLRCYKQVLEGLGPGQPLFNNLLALDKIWSKGAGGSLVQFPGGKSVRVVKRGLLFSPPDKER